MATSRPYDEHGALSGIELRVAGMPTWSQRLTRDSIGRILTQRDSDATTGVVVTGYHYDAQDRLDQVTRDGVLAQAFTFDDAGNRTAVTTSAGTVAATYANDDRILSYDGEPIAHDASGARASEVRGADTLGYQYDDLGRLTQLTSTTNAALTFKYDASGRRVQELRGDAVVRSILYGGAAAPLAEVTAVGTVRSEFVSVAGDVAPDYLIQGTTTYYLLHDQLGSVRQVIDVTSGSVAQAVDYDANGVVTRNTATGFQPFGYAGGLSDADGQTVHFGARDYDARTGRWVQPDPIGAIGGANRFLYANEDPIGHRDQSGLRTEVIIWHPVGKGGSSFGHVSVTINGWSYSFGENGMTIEPEATYLKRNSFREGLGLVLNLTAAQEQALEESLKNFKRKYNALTTNCGDPIESELEKLGFKLGPNLFPASLGSAIIDAGLVTSTVPHPQTTPSNGWNAPWTKF